MSASLGGVLAAVLTPIHSTLAPNHGRLALHCRWLLDHGCNALAILGTTGEANSFSVEERIDILDHLVAYGIPAALLLPGTGCCALPDTVRLTRHAADHGVAGVLMLPPFYYKNVTDDGLFAAYAEVIERVGSVRLRIFLYHFPQLSGIPLGIPLVERLRQRYPQNICGFKDSSGDADSMRRLIQAVPGLAVFTGSDDFLLDVLRQGGAGCITAVSNIAGRLAHAIVLAVQRGDFVLAQQMQDQLHAVRQAIAAYPVSAALKALLARHLGEESWRFLRPPLVPLDARAEGALLATLDRIGFVMPAVP
jgi:4-hydroxy-tetrahydrodipicolinate synthase